MTLSVGEQFGPYKIGELIAAGGMGEVYQAHDTRLGRGVAIKILPAELATDAERLRRFHQEASACSALNHPNLLTVFDVGTHEDVPYLVMELLKGDTLRHKLREGALPLRQSLEIGAQVARGLAAAHEHRIIHRDLKPENLFVMRDGRVKILDFGLAKLIPQIPTSQLSEALTASKGTDAGVVLGTVGYMSPEQVRGEAVDHHSDLFALGCILYEMVCGQRAFHRPTSAETMTAILKEDPVNILELKSEVPPTFVRIVERCLAKRPENRFQTATDLAFALETVSGFSTTVAAAAVRPHALRSVRQFGLWSAGLLFATIISAALVWNLKRSPSVVSMPSTRIALSIPSDERLPILNLPPPFSLSPDGNLLAYTAYKGGVRQLFLRSLDSLHGKAVSGSEGAHGGPFFSPDGKWVAFFAQGKLKKVPVSGGEPVALTDVPYG